MKLAVIQDWIDDVGGGEKVSGAVVEAHQADMFTVFDLRAERGSDFHGAPVMASAIDKIDAIRKRHRFALPLAMRAVEHFDLSAYDTVFSVTTAVAKGVITTPEQRHVAYINTPARYAWGMTAEYLATLGGPLAGLKRLLAAEMLHHYRMWDLRTIPSIDVLVANSRFVQQRIWKYYRREAAVVYPPVDTAAFTPHHGPREDYYVTASRMVPYKRVPMIVEAFAAMPGKRLVVIGDGPDMAAAKAVAGPNIEFVGHQSTEAMRDLFQRARAFVFAALEDFGILPVEAQACGTPVIAYNRGGAAETVRGLGLHHRPTGIFFEEQSAAAIAGAVHRFEQNADSFTSLNCVDNAARFSRGRFTQEMAAVLSNQTEQSIRLKLA